MKLLGDRVPVAAEPGWGSWTLGSTLFKPRGSPSLSQKQELGSVQGPTAPPSLPLPASASHSDTQGITSAAALSQLESRI